MLEDRKVEYMMRRAALMGWEDGSIRYSRAFRASHALPTLLLLSLFKTLEIHCPIALKLVKSIPVS